MRFMELSQSHCQIEPSSDHFLLSLFSSGGKRAGENNDFLYDIWLVQWQSGEVAVTSHSWFSTTLSESLSNFYQDISALLCLLRSLGKCTRHRACHEPRVWEDFVRFRDGHQGSEVMGISHPDANGRFMQGFHKKQKKTLMTFRRLLPVSFYSKNHDNHTHNNNKSYQV